MLNLCLREKMKKVFVIMTTAGITLVNAGCVSGCEKQNDDDFMQPGGYSSDVDSTTPKKEDDYADVKIYSTDKRNEKFDESSNIVKETTTTSIGEGVLATNPYTKSNVVVTIANDVKNHNTVTDVVYATTKPVTKATTKPVSKSTTKITLKTTKATTKATTTTTTTTTTVPVTELPVVVTEAPVTEAPNPGYIDPHDIRLANDYPEIFEIVANDLRLKIIENYPVAPNTRIRAYIGYDTYMGAEPRMIVQMLNAKDITNPDVYSYIFGDYSYEEMQKWENFALCFKSILDDFGCDLNYYDIVIDPEVANFMNEIHARRNDRDSLKTFIDDQIIEGHASPDVLSSPQILPIVYSYYDGFDRAWIDDIYYSNVDAVYSTSHSMTR